MVRNYLDYAGLKRVIGKLFGIRRIWHGTLEEWEALTPAERDYYDQAEVIDNGIVEEQYTTEEVYTGKKWIDGKKIYRKVMQGTTPSVLDAWNTVFDVTGLNIDNVIKTEGYVLNTSTYRVIIPSHGLALQFGVPNANSIGGWCYTPDWRSKPIICVVEYTKTAD